jgi:hypothetical protein
VAGIVRKLRADVETQEQYDETIEKVLPEIQKLFQAKQNLVLAKYGVTREVMEQCIHSSTNETVVALIQHYEKMYLDAVQG